MRVGDEHHVPVALPPAKRRSALGTGDCVGSRAGLDRCEKCDATGILIVNGAR